MEGGGLYCDMALSIYAAGATGGGGRGRIAERPHDIYLQRAESQACTRGNKVMGGGHFLEIEAYFTIVRTCSCTWLVRIQHCEGNYISPMH